MKAQNYKEELEQIREDLAHAKFGSFLIIPLKYDDAHIKSDWFKEVAERQPITTMDINEAIKNNLNNMNGLQILKRYYLSGDNLIKLLFGDAFAQDANFYVSEKDTALSEEAIEQEFFQFYCAYIYVFHSQVAFLCLGLTYPKVQIIERICNLGSADSIAEYFYRDASGLHRFSLDEKLSALCDMAGLECFFQNGASLFLESYTYTLALVRQRFQYLESIHRLAFNLHQMIPLGVMMEDESEDDISYVDAVKSRALGTYRWGCCVTSQTISYIVADETMNLEAELHTQAEDGLPVILLALYEKYTCLRFTELLASADKKQIHLLRSLNKQMLEFRAYGTIHPSHISRWYNVKQIYRHMIETNDIEAAIADIGDKLAILDEHQKEIEANTNEALMSLITIFGVVSILESLIAIIQILVGGDPIGWSMTIIMLMAITVGAMILILRRKKGD